MTLHEIWRMARRTPRILRNAARDRRYGALLGGTSPSRFAHLGAHDVSNTEYEDMPSLFGAARIGPEDLIVDVGVGKGRSLNWLIENYPQNRIVGIELDPEVATRTATRLRRFGNIAIETGDATERLPHDGTVFYLFNPFDESVMRRFVEAFTAEGMHPDRRAVYHNAKYVHLFREDERFRVEEIELPSHSFTSVLISLRR